MSSKRRLRRICAKKKRFPTEHDVYAHVLWRQKSGSWDGRPWHPYRCTLCNGWHYGRPKL